MVLDVDGHGVRTSGVWWDHGMDWDGMNDC